MWRRSVFITTGAAIVLALIVGCNGLLQDDSPEGIDIVEEVWSLVLEDYIDSDELNDDDLAEAAIRGLLEAVDDPHTVYLNPEFTQIEQSELDGGFSGIGATITMREGELIVVAPIDASPAERAGIKPGDKILSVDGQLIAGMSIIEAQLKIRGKDGTKVTLSILHQDEDVPVEIEIIREKIDVPSVYFEIVSDSIAHITLTSFSSRTGEQLESALEKVSEQDAEGIILDLRDNLGGLVDSAVDVVSQFIEEGTVVYALDNEGERRDWLVSKGGMALDIPMIILVNANSASASEVVAGALQDYERGAVIGSVTYGKGSMQHVQDLSNGGSLRVTFAKWYTPNGQQIDDIGITPDIVIENSAEDAQNESDPQLEKAIEFLFEN